MLLRTATYCSKFFTNINLFKPDNDFLRKNGLVQRGKSKIAPGACGSLDCVGPSQEMTRWRWGKLKLTEHIEKQLWQEISGHNE